jgi:hypothetical protein
MFTIDMVELMCPEHGCEKPARVLLKIKNESGYFSTEVYCRKHGQAVRDVNKADWTKRRLEFKDLT